MLCDERGDVCKSYGVSSLVGGLLGFASRASVLIDGDGIVRKTYPSVSVSKHAREVLDDAVALGLSAPPGRA